MPGEQIRDVFQLVKQVANFSHIIYILAMDRDIVCRALTQVHNMNGNKYIEKIIQIPIEIPKASKLKLMNVLKGKFENIINSNKYHKKNINKEYLDHIYENCVQPYINNLRDIYRLINVLNFRYSVLYKETSVEDFLGITSIEVFEPTLYTWIYNNKNKITGEYELYNNKNTDYREECIKEFKSLEINPEFAIKCISTMFPRFKNIVNEYGGYNSSVNLIAEMRIASEYKFDKYFEFNLNDILIERIEIENCICSMPKKDLQIKINDFIGPNRFFYFIEETNELVDIIPYERLNFIATILAASLSKIKDRTISEIYEKTTTDKTIDIIGKILKKT